MRINEFKDIKIEDLNYAEKETYEQWMKNLEVRQMSLEDFREGITKMKNGVAEELADLPSKDERNYVLKARLKNYILLEKVLNTPKQAREALEKALAKVDIKAKPSI
jgi:hypothetical protein